MAYLSIDIIAEQLILPLTSLNTLFFFLKKNAFEGIFKICYFCFMYFDGCPYACIGTMFVPGRQSGQKSVMLPMELEWLKVLSILSAGE